MSEAAELVLASYGVAILAQRPGPEVDVRDGLLDALDADAEHDGLAGRP